MTECQRCLKKFRDQYTLKRHMTRINQCKEQKSEKINKPNSPNLTIDSQNLTIDSPNLTIDSPNLTIGSPNLTINKCGFCLNTFCNIFSLKRHVNVCKLKDDPVRLLEIEKDIKPDSNTSKNECRFCNKFFFNSSSLYRHFNICKDRKEYHQKLLNLKKETTINNNTVNNTVNNITIINNNSLNFGHFDNSHIPTDEIPDMCLEIIKKNKYDTIYYQAGLIMISYDKRLMENPANHNAEIPSNFRGYSNIKTNKGIKRIKSKQVINKVSQVVSKKLLSQFKELEKIGKIRTDKSKDIMKHVDGLAEEGILVYSPESEDEEDIYNIRKKYTEYKMNESEIWDDLISDSDNEF
jgi:hypothetical protein